MLEMDTPSDADIPESIMLSRLARAEQLREFFIQRWLRNPALAEQAGPTVQGILSPARRPAQTDFSG